MPKYGEEDTYNIVMPRSQAHLYIYTYSVAELEKVKVFFFVEVFLV